MKTLTLLLNSTLLLTYSVLSAQTVEPKNELGTKLYSYSTTQSYYKRIDIDHHFVNGIQYKRLLTKSFALRFLLSYTEKYESDYGKYSIQTAVSDNSFPKGGSGVLYLNSKDQLTELFIGIEKRWTIGKFAPYIYSDISTGSLRIKRFSSWISDNSSEKTEWSDNRNVFMVGLCGGGGLMYKVTQHIYLTAESGFSYSVPYGDEIRTYAQPNYIPINAITLGARF